MLRALLTKLTGRTGEDEADGESGFVPSRLDASVLEGHGLRTAEAERELADLDEQSDALEDAHRQPRE